MEKIGKTECPGRPNQSSGEEKWQSQGVVSQQGGGRRPSSVGGKRGHNSEREKRREESRRGGFLPLELVQESQDFLSTSGSIDIFSSTLGGSSGRRLSAIPSEK